MSFQRVVVVSIDGVAPRFVTPASMPRLCRLARQGASCFSAQTVHPSITLPAHASLLRGISPQVHGIFDNRPLPIGDDHPSFLAVARRQGLRTAALLNWQPIDQIVEADAVDVRHFLDGGYGQDDDARLARAARTVVEDASDVMFAYFVSPDLAGHDSGWGSKEYHRALARSDEALGVLLDAVGDDVAVIVTTDHGGHERDHCRSEPLDTETFVVVRAGSIAAGTNIEHATILDVAPTVAELAGFDPAPSWSGTSLVGVERRLVDVLFSMLEEMAEHTYGEQLNMLDHSLQTAASVTASGGTDDQVLAGLLHDIGHLLGDAGRWGLAGHSAVGARFLQQMLPASIVEPIRLHVAAKRHLVAVDAEHLDRLSVASLETLAQQGGPFSEAESSAFLDEAWATEAMDLRRHDDAGKAPGTTVPPLDHYAALLESALNAAPLDSRWLRDSCACVTCRDTVSGQHLLGVGDLDGWTIRGKRSDGHLLEHSDGSTHVVIAGADVGRPGVHTPWFAGHLDTVRARADTAGGDLARFRSDLATFGLALVRDLEPVPGNVLDFAACLGFVRATNYGELFDVRTTPAATNLAFTDLGLPLHTDNPYRDPVPTVQLLHCLQPADAGGASRFSDGSAAAQRLRDTDPAAFEVLTTTSLLFRFRSEEVDLCAQRPMIALDADGRVTAIAVNHRSMCVPEPGVTTSAFYDAYAAFQTILESDEHVIELDLGVGDVVAFDNRRVLHARTAFSGASTRHLQGCYVDPG